MSAPLAPAPVRPDWIAVDWGTSRLRAWALDAEGGIAAEASSDAGMSRMEPGGFEAALLALIGDWLPPGRVTPVLACGMVGSRQGWVQAPYRAVPCTPLVAGSFAEAPVLDPRLAVHILPGLNQPVPADVMRGEETQIAGFLAGTPDFDGVLCLPGTHTKWVRISAGEVVSFQTFMTGELFALLANQSVLLHSVKTAGWSDDAFAMAVDDALSRPDRLAARLFALRAEGLLDDLPPETARARLSGALIGAELAAAKPYWLGQEIVIIGAEEVSEAYAAALTRQGLAPRWVSGDTAALAGLAAARGLLRQGK